MVLKAPVSNKRFVADFAVLVELIGGREYMHSVCSLCVAGVAVCCSKLQCAAVQSSVLQ